MALTLMCRPGIWLAGLAFCFLTVLAASPVAATPVSPSDSALTDLGLLPGGDLTIDTGTTGDAGSTPILTYGGGTLNGTIISQSGGPDIAAFLFSDASVLAAGDLISVTAGSRPLALLFNGGATLRGTIDVSGGDGADGGYKLTGTRGAGVAGGGNGGYGCCFSSPEAGVGPGGGEAGASSGGSVSGPGAGGGFGTAGGNTGAGTSYVYGGAAYGPSLDDTLEGGSGGGGGGGRCCNGATFDGGSGGGAGGGGLEIGALTLLSLEGADILANGGNGGVGGRSGGGGSGGGIFLHAFDIALDSASLLQANGGNGGGCGGAGRIEVLTNTQGSFSNGGSIEAKGGTVGDGCTDSQLLVTRLDTIGVAGTTSPTDPTGVPEPGGLGMLGFALAGLFGARKHKEKRAS